MSFAIPAARRLRLPHPAGLAVAALFALAGCSKAPPPPPVIEVSSLRLQPRAAIVTESYVAQTEAHNAVEIRPRVGGVLEKQLVADGETVKQGTDLFIVDPQPYIVALAQARAGLAEAEAAQEQAARDFDRVQPLLTIDAISRQDYDAALARSVAGRASVEAAKAQVRAAELNLGYTVIEAPIDGVMGRAQIKRGGLVNANSTLLATLYSVDPMYVDFSISERRMLAFQRELGRPADQHSKTPPPYHLVLADGSDYPYAPKLNFIDPAVDRNTGTLAVRLEVPNPDKMLRAGQFARVVLDVQQLKDALLLPQRAVQDLQGQTFVWIVDGEGKAQTRDVTMGARVGSDWLVQKGLQSGDTVIVDGVQRLKPGVPVKAEPLPQPAGPAPAGAPQDKQSPPGNAAQQGNKPAPQGNKPAPQGNKPAPQGGKAS